MTEPIRYAVTATATREYDGWTRTTQLPYVEVVAIDKRAASMAACREYRRRLPLTFNGCEIDLSIEEI